MQSANGVTIGFIRISEEIFVRIGMKNVVHGRVNFPVHLFIQRGQVITSDRQLMILSCENSHDTDLFALYSTFTIE